MRVLFTFIGGSGHFEPLVPLAWAVAAAGHSLAFSCGPGMAPTVEAVGFTVFRLGAGGAGGAPERAPLRPLDPAREDAEFRERFVERAARARAPLTATLCATWQPDVLVCDEADFGGMLAAESLGIPYATMLVMAAGSFVRHEIVGAPLAALRAELGLPPDPELVMLRRHLVLAPFPPSFRDPAFPLPPTAQLLRPPPLLEDDGMPPWPGGRPGVPTVYVTLGTIFNLESGNLFTRVLAGVRELPINVVVTIGREIDPAELGPQPGHIHIARYIPQARVLPYCRAVVSHGGSGSVLGTLAHGLPAVLIPLGADQPQNAARAAAMGLGLALDPIAATPEEVRDGVTAVLGEPRFRRAAETLRDELAAMPGPAEAVARLEQVLQA
jgi:UDP:flavonoid glycosyltransferase YjiC (YdhE family)